MIIRINKAQKSPTGKMLKAGKVIETSHGHTYTDFEVLAEDGHFSSPQNNGLKQRLEAEKAAKKTVKVAPKATEEKTKTDNK